MSMFDEEFRRGSTPSRTRPHGNLLILRLAVLLLFGVLVVRLVDMQIVKGNEYARRSRESPSASCLRGGKMQRRALDGELAAR